MVKLASGDPLAREVTTAIQNGDVAALRKLLSETSGLATARIEDERGHQRTLLHIATDWPGHFPNGPEIVSTLIANGAEVNAAFVGPHAETPLHWAASNDDVRVLETLLDGGADIEARGSVIDGGSPLADAVAFAQWKAAGRLVERGARTTLWQAAALGLLDRVEQYFSAGVNPSAAEVTNALWCACHGGQRATAEYLLDRGGDPNWVGHDGLTPINAAARAGASELVAWLRLRASQKST